MSDDFIVLNNISRKNINKIGKDYPYFTALPVTGNEKYDWCYRKDYYFIDDDKVWFLLGNMITMAQPKLEEWVNILYNSMKNDEDANNVRMWGGDIHSVWSGDRLKEMLLSRYYSPTVFSKFVFSKKPYEPSHYYHEFELRGHNTHKKSHPRTKYVCPEKMF